MSDTKACNLTENEIRYLIAHIGNRLYTHEEPDAKIERINYLNKRLKTFREVEVKSETNLPVTGNAALSNDGWPTNG